MKAEAIPLPRLDEQAPVARGSLTISLGAIVGALFALLTLDNVLLLGFLGHAIAPVGLLALSLPTAMAYLTVRALGEAPRVEVRTLLICLAVAVVMLLLGGEGRLFFATDDWQIRDAVLADMATHSWPFDYWLDGRSQVLRAPIGMYLLPALLGSVSQGARDAALLAQNSLVLGLILSAGAVLFEGRRARLIALVLFIMFSGLDIIGNSIAQWALGAADWDHIERWADNHQFSAHITQIFWVPQHAFASWVCALTYLLWRRGLAPIGLFAGSIALAALWSPFAIFGALPFAIFVGLTALATRAWTWRDLAFAAIAGAIALPSLAYLRADAASVWSGMRPFPVLLYMLVIGLEVAPFLGPLLADRTGRTDRTTLLIAGACLLFVPIWAIGPGGDFQMRTSIMPLALVAIAFADWAIGLRAVPARVYVLGVVALGSVTGVVELYRAVRLEPSPPPHCSLVGVWTRQSGLIAPYSSYFASRSALPAVLAPQAPVARAGPIEPGRCWDRPWRTKRRLPS